MHLLSSSTRNSSPAQRSVRSARKSNFYQYQYQFTWLSKATAPNPGRTAGKAWTPAADRLGSEQGP